jgi:hypothetical protein
MMSPKLFMLTPLPAPRAGVRSFFECALIELMPNTAADKVLSSFWDMVKTSAVRTEDFAAADTYNGPLLPHITC